MSTTDLHKKSIKYRKNILKYIYHANAGHTGGSLSCIDILNVLYNHAMNVGPVNFNSPDRDRYIQSKGHSVEALFVVLADKGFFPESDLET
ncbi:MAG TPA: transketolase, partial [Chitinophagaceae bacterium]|nr:transketolase [Chitinophagaceae bacterium]